MRVLAGLIALVIALPIGLLAAAEWQSRRVWRRCDGSQAVSAASLRDAVERELLPFRPQCELAVDQLICRWRTPFNRWACCARVDAGQTAGNCGSG